MHLMELKAFQKQNWEALKETLVKFGKLSGLFQSIDVKNPEGPGGPFQLRVKVRGPNANIVDVGYGVSQVLPILQHILDHPISRRRIPQEMPLSPYCNSLKFICTRESKPNYLLCWQQSRAKVSAHSSLRHTATT